MERYHINIKYSTLMYLNTNILKLLLFHLYLIARPISNYSLTTGTRL